jgi:hypothetical protein
MIHNKKKWMSIAVSAMIFMSFIFTGCEDKKDKDVHVTGVSLCPVALMLPVGEQITLDAIVSPSDADNKEIHWHSTNENVATVENGVVKTISWGQTLIIAKSTDKPFSDTTFIYVNPRSVEDDYASFLTGFYNGTMTMIGDSPSIVSENSLITTSYNDKNKILLGVNDYFVIAQMNNTKVPIKVDCVVELKEETPGSYSGTGDTNVTFIQGLSFPVKLHVVLDKEKNMILTINVATGELMGGNIIVEFRGKCHSQSIDCLQLFSK